MILVAQKQTLLTMEWSARKSQSQKIFPEQLFKIIKTHVGGGFTAKEAAAFGWPKGVYTPIKLEEKIVSYADKLVDNSKRGRFQ